MRFYLGLIEPTGCLVVPSRVDRSLQSVHVLCGDSLVKVPSILKSTRFFLFLPSTSRIYILQRISPPPQFRSSAVQLCLLVLSVEQADTDLRSRQLHTDFKMSSAQQRLSSIANQLSGTSESAARQKILAQNPDDIVSPDHVLAIYSLPKKYMDWMR